MKTIQRRILNGLTQWSLALSLGLTTILGSAQDFAVTGKVTDRQDGRPIPGVNVVNKGTDQGTITDADGVYRISGIRQDAMLIFSYVGMQTQEVTVSHRSVIDVSLQQDVKQLSEIVVTGTGVPVDKRNLAFAVESVKASSLPQVPAASIDQALVGRIPGAQISSVNGIPGAEVSILLRGINTINRDIQPIIMVDGVQMAATQFNALDPGTIERVEVVQGAASATMYGAQGANGVIQVFTKRGKAGRMKVDISLNGGINEFLNVGGVRKSMHHGFTTNYKNEVTLADTTKLLVQSDETLMYSGFSPYKLDSSTTKWDKSYDQNLKYRDHFSEFMRPAPFHSANVNFSGGSEKMDYNIGLSNMRQESTFTSGNYNERTNVAINVSAEVVKGLQLRSVTQLIYNRNNLGGYEKPEFFGANQIFATVLYAQPFLDFSKKDIDGNYGFFYGNIGGVNGRNPNYMQQYSSALDNKIDILQNFSVQYKFPKYVEADVLYGINHQNRDFTYEIGNQTLNRNSVASRRVFAWNNFNDASGELTSNHNKQTFQNFKASVTAQLDLDKDLHIGVPLRSATQVAYDYRRNTLSRLEFYALGMPVMPPASSIQGSEFGVFQDLKSEFVTYGYLVNQRLDYGELAGISGGFRSDYSSAFGRGSKPFVFPRGDAYFRLSGLNFWNSSGLSKQILEWKFRAAYGAAGIQPQPYDRYVTLGSKAIGSSNTLFIPPVQANPDLNVEVSKEFEAGTDLYLEGLKGDWLKGSELSFTYWTRKTDNAIWPVPAPPSAGVQSRKANAIGLQSDGIQASLKVNVLQSRQATWNLVVNYSRQQSIISKVVGDQIIHNQRVLRAGSPVGEFYGWMMLHEVDQRKPDGTPFIPQVGDIDPQTKLPYDSSETQAAYELASNGWVVNTKSKKAFISQDRYSLGSPNPDFIWSIINDFTFRSFLTASIQLDGMVGNKLYNNTRQWMYRDAVHSDYENSITIEGDTAPWTAFYQSAYTPSKWDKNYFLEDASFVRLRTASVGVDFARLFTMRGIGRLQLVLTGRNLWTLTDYSGLDPEVSTYSIPNPNYYAPTQALDRGVDNATIPNSRSYQVTLNISF
jgi:TonB-linked SusC/RagA family outer membrane protein